jgi:hypothetical protein
LRIVTGHSTAELRDARRDSLARNVELSDGDGQLEAPRTGTARIDIENAVTSFDEWLM